MMERRADTPTSPEARSRDTDASDDGPDPGRSAEREAQDHVLDHAARGESWLKQMWRALRASTGRPPPSDQRP